MKAHKDAALEFSCDEPEATFATPQYDAIRCPCSRLPHPASEPFLSHYGILAHSVQILIFCDHEKQLGLCEAARWMTSVCCRGGVVESSDT